MQAHLGVDAEPLLTGQGGEAIPLGQGGQAAQAPQGGVHPLRGARGGGPRLLLVRLQRLVPPLQLLVPRFLRTAEASV